MRRPGLRRTVRGHAPLLLDDRVVGTLTAYAELAGPGLVRAAGEVARWVSGQLELAELDESRSRLAEAQVSALRAQISPHFVYNALTAIASFVRTDPARARELLLYGGLISAVVLVIFSPVVSGKPAATPGGPSTSLFTNPDVDFSWFPLDNPGLVSIPIGFFCGWLGTVLSKECNAEKYAEMEVRALTGAGSEKAVAH